MKREIAKRLDECMSAERLFLDRKLTLSGLAMRVGTNRTYMSNYLNNALHKTFFEYVNSFRLEYATQLLLTTQLTLAVIAEQSGFNSLSTFRRCFQRAYGCSAVAYRKANAQPTVAMRP